jgi:hypothetical protein
MKRFDYAADVAKQLITIASAVIGVAFSFYDKIFSHNLLVRIAMIIVLAIFAGSIFLGIRSLGGLVTLVERQEGPPPPTGPHHVILMGTPAARYAQDQQITFLAALGLFLLLALIDGVFSSMPPGIDH